MDPDQMSESHDRNHLAFQVHTRIKSSNEVVTGLEREQHYNVF